MKPIVASVTVSVLLSAAVAVAQPDPIAARFRQLDTDADGKLSAAELQPYPALAARLKGADKNGDGLLTLEEIRQHLGQSAQPKTEPRPEPTPEPKTEPKSEPKAEPKSEPKTEPKSDPKSEPKSEPKAQTTSSADSVREGPKMRLASEAGVGRMVPDAALKLLDGREVRLRELVGKNGLLIAFTNTSCPLCGRYAPTLAELEKPLSAGGVSVLYVNPTANESAEAARAFAAAHKLSGAYTLDAVGSLARTLSAVSTAEVFLLDRKRTVVYRGAVDDQYGLGYSLEAPKRRFLSDAVAAMLAGEPPQPAATTAPGCVLDLGSAKPTATAVTYHNRISRIVQSHCVECHRSGGVAPFSLESYADVTAHAGMIAKVVEAGTMPPWFASPAPAGKPSPWLNDRTLPTDVKADLLSWLRSDRPAGDAGDAPLPRSFEGGWLIGKPDAVFEFPKPVAVKATGTMPYQNVVVETHLTEDKWVRAVEVRPGARDVVHHVLVFVTGPGRGEGRGNAPGGDADGDRSDPAAEARRGFFAIYVPGQSVLSYPEGYAKRLPKGSRLRFQMHYTPSGTATEDRTRIGIVFSDRPPEYEVRVAGLVNARLSIPPGAANHPESAVQRFPSSAKVLGFLPHMHLRGKAFRYEITAPDGGSETVLDVPRYDFNWQLYYRLTEPRPVSAGTAVKATGWFDNSSANPANPDPKRTVRWGPQTTDEMMLGYVEYVVPVGTPEAATPSGAGRDSQALFKRVDADGDGKITRAEYDRFVKLVPTLRSSPEQAQQLFTRLDADRDGCISPTELSRLNEAR